MIEALLMIAFIGCIISVPLACFSVGAVYARAGFASSWSMTLFVLGGFAILGAVSMLGVFGNAGLGSSQTGILVVFLAAIIVTAAAILLAIRKWPAIPGASE